ncbi:MAG: hypothetical protein DCC64_00900 [Planctomycetota bacterium]|nr:MAG: hypothetical protein DCC64_00900 [Planctomycetota bacterium]
MKPPPALIHWARAGTAARGLRDTMLALVEFLARARDLPTGSLAPLPRDETLTEVVQQPASAPAEWIGQVYETLLAAAARRAQGIHFTPPDVASEVVEATLAPLEGPLRIIDPAMGCGAFLLAAARFCRGQAGRSPLLEGFDTDPLAVELARWSLALETGLVPEAFEGLRAGDALRDVRGEYDAVVGNPPFGNAIERRTARSVGYAAEMRRLYPEFARGAYDYSLLFFALASRLLSPQGRYGLIGPTALLSDAKPWQRYVQEQMRPSLLILYPVDRFGQARIRTTAFVGGRGRCEQVEVRDYDGGQAPKTRRWSDSAGTWFEVVREAPPVASFQKLREVATVFAGCTTSAAYRLAPLVTEARQEGDRGGALRLVTTGALDRYRCKWGDEPIRFLGRDFARPLWPQEGPRDVMAAMERQRRPKILLGGLTSVLEAWYDVEGGAGGVVSTWVILPRPGVDAWTLLALLNGATISRVYMARHGAKSMSGRQTTIGKQALHDLPLPDLARCRELGLRARALQEQAPDEAADRELHLEVARLLGRSEVQAQEDLAWWQGQAARTRATRRV